MPFTLCRGPPGSFKTRRTLGNNKCRDRAVMEHVPKQRTTRSAKMMNGDQKPPTPLTILKHATRKHDRRRHVRPTTILVAFSRTSRRRKPESFDCSPNSSNINSEPYTPNLPAKKKCKILNNVQRMPPEPKPQVTTWPSRRSAAKATAEARMSTTSVLGSGVWRPQKMQKPKS